MSRCHVLGNEYCLLDSLGFWSTHIFNQPFKQHFDWRGQTTAEPLHQQTIIEYLRLGLEGLHRTFTENNQRGTRGNTVTLRTIR